jgi:hypothetical protein
LALDGENIYDEEKQHDRENGTESEIELLPNRHQKSLHILTAGIPAKKTHLAMRVMRAAFFTATVNRPGVSGREGAMEMPIPAVSTVGARDELRPYRKHSLVVTAAVMFSTDSLQVVEVSGRSRSTYSVSSCDAD